MSNEATLVLRVDESDVEKGTKKANKALQGTKEEGGGLIKSFKDVDKSIGKSGKSLAIFGGVALAAVTAVAVGVGALINSMKVVNDAQKVFALKDGDAGIQRLKDLRKFGSEAGLGLEATTEIATKLGSAFKNTQNAQEALKVIADLKALVPTVDIGGLTDDFVELTAKAQLGAGDVEKFAKKLGTVSPTVEQIGRITGQTGAQVSESIKKGTLASADFAGALRLAALEAGKTGVAGEAALNFAKNDPAAQVMRVTDSLTTLKENFASGLLGGDGGTVGLTKLADILNNLASSPAVKAFGEGLRKTFNAIAKAIAPITDNVGVLQPVLDTLASAFNKIIANGTAVKVILAIVAGVFIAMNLPIIATIAAIAALAVGAAYLIDNWKAVTNFFSGFGAFFTNVFNIAIGAVKGFISGAINSFFELPIAIASVVTKMVDAIGEFIGLGPGLGTNIIDGIINGITAGAGKLVGAVKGAANSALGAFKGVLGIASPSKAFAELGGYTVEGYTNALDSGQKDVTSSASVLAASAITGASRVPSGPIGGSSQTSTSSVNNAPNITVNLNMGSSPSGTSQDAQAFGLMVKKAVDEQLRQIVFTQSLSNA